MYWISSWTMDKIALAISRRTVSPILIGQTLGFLYNAINWQAKKEDIPQGSMNEVHRRLATAKSASHKLSETVWKSTHMHACIKAEAYRPEGPAAPWNLRVTQQCIQHPIDQAE